MGIVFLSQSWLKTLFVLLGYKSTILVQIENVILRSDQNKKNKIFKKKIKKQTINSKHKNCKF